MSELTEKIQRIRDRLDNIANGRPAHWVRADSPYGEFYDGLNYHKSMGGNIYCSTLLGSVAMPTPTKGDEP